MLIPFGGAGAGGRRRLSLLSIVLTASCRGPVEPETFNGAVLPIEGVPGETIFFGPYLDHGGRDYQCGAKTYEGHGGTDILIRNFQVQDSGVRVLAAMDGVVVAVTDGLPDRNTQRGGTLGNEIAIRRDDGLLAVYGHLRRQSIMVSVGERVVAGSPIGQVGSSGGSSWPHLHFEIIRDGRHLDPFLGPCNDNTTRFWREQVRYQDDFRLLDAGVTDLDVLTPAVLLERLPPLPSAPRTLPSVSLWVEVSDLVCSGLRVVARSPTGAIGYQWEGAGVSIRGLAFLTYAIPVAGTLLESGAWSMELWQRSTETAELVQVAAVGLILEQVAVPSAPEAPPSRRRGS